MARNVRRIRVAQGISQEKLAIEASIDRAYLGGLERAQENPTVDLLDRLAAVLEVSIGEFFLEPKKNEPEPKNLKQGRRAVSSTKK